MPGAFDKFDKFDKAFDLVRNQTELFDDDADIVYVPRISSKPASSDANSLNTGPTMKESSLKISRTCSVVSKTFGRQPEQTMRRLQVHFESH
jgi:hypothetical protein